MSEEISDVVAQEEFERIRKKFEKGFLVISISAVSTFYSAIIKYGEHSNSARFYSWDFCKERPDAILDNVGTFFKVLEPSIVDGIVIGGATSLTLLTAYYVGKGINYIIQNQFNKVENEKKSVQEIYESTESQQQSL